MRLTACSSVRLRPACVNRPAPSTRLAGRGAGVAVACFFRISAVCRSRWRAGLTGLVCLLVPMVVGRFRPAMCGCADFVDRVRCGCHGCFAMVYCHCVVREDEHGIGSSGFLSLVFLTRFPLRLTPTSSIVSTLIAATGVLLILSLRPIAHGSLLSTRSAPSACLITVDGAECFYADLSYSELVKTAPADAMISVNQSINVPASSRPSPRLSCRAGGAAIACSAVFHFRSFLYISG